MGGGYRESMLTLITMQSESAICRYLLVRFLVRGKRTVLEKVLMAE